MNIGIMVKDLRTKKNMTLRELAKKTNLSIGYLSQLERSLTSVAVDTLKDIAYALEVDLNYFLNVSNESRENIIHSYEQRISFIESEHYIHSYLSRDLSNNSLFPELITLLPAFDNSKKEKEKETTFSHKAEEFIYVLEGILTVNYSGNIANMYPGDSFLFKSTVTHNWYNATNQLTKILVVHYPNPFLNNSV